jgi:hypothetical protein
MTTIERQKRKAAREPITYTPGLEEHLRRTGEKPPASWWHQPADMLGHGGYYVSRAGAIVGGPFAWYENAERAAGKLEGVVVTLKNRN